MGVLLDELAQALRIVLGHVPHDIHAPVRFQVAALMRQLLHRFIVGRQRFQLDHREVAALLEIALLIEDIRNAAAHAGCEISSNGAEHDDDAARHVFAAMVAGAFDDGDGAGIAHGKSLAGDAAEITLAGNRAVEHGVADDDAFLGHDLAFVRRADHRAGRRSVLCRHSRWLRR